MAYLEITLDIKPENRAKAAEAYHKYREVFLSEVRGAHSKDLLVRPEDVQVLHGFANAQNAQAYLDSRLFNDDVVEGLKPLLAGPPEIRIYEA